MLPTPSTSHVSFATIYEPAEDSFLLLDTLSSPAETAWLHSRCRLHDPLPLVVELGTGSGVVIAFLAANAAPIFGTDILALGVDVNSNACRATELTVTKSLVEQGSASLYLGSTCADLTSALRLGLVDVLVFNPPYVPTADLPKLPAAVSVCQADKFAEESALLALSYAGGALGMETTERLLEALPEVLSERGVAYVLLCAQNRPEEVKGRIREWERMREGRAWRAETVGRSGKTAGWEKLEIIRIWLDEAER